MAKRGVQSVDPDDDRAERFRQVRHFQTLRWAYLSTYLIAAAWFVAASYDTDSSLPNAPLAILAVGVAVSSLGVFLAIRIEHFTEIIYHDLQHIRADLPLKGWIEHVFVYALSAALLVFTLFRFAIAALDQARCHHILPPWH